MRPSPRPPATGASGLSRRGVAATLLNSSPALKGPGAWGVVEPSPTVKLCENTSNRLMAHKVRYSLSQIPVITINPVRGTFVLLTALTKPWAGTGSDAPAFRAFAPRLLDDYLKRRYRCPS
eukprot:7121685-Pyramimonas_sp.AAC.1